MNDVNFAFLGRVTYQLSSDTDFHYDIPKLENWDASNLDGFKKQPSVLDGVDFEWVKHSGDSDTGFNGVIAIDIPFSDGYMIVITWCD